VGKVSIAKNKCWEKGSNKGYRGVAFEVIVAPEKARGSGDLQCRCRSLNFPHLYMLYGTD
jgi:hypothetical protein